MRLVGVSGVGSDIGESETGSRKVDRATQAEDPGQCLGPVAKRFEGTTANLSLADAQRIRHAPDRDPRAKLTHHLRDGRTTMIGTVRVDGHRLEHGIGFAAGGQTILHATNLSGRPNGLELNTLVRELMGGNAEDVGTEPGREPDPDHGPTWWARNEVRLGVRTGDEER